LVRLFVERARFPVVEVTAHDDEQRVRYSGLSAAVAALVTHRGWPCQEKGGKKKAGTMVPASQQTVHNH
jgi:hypothetical protein